MKKIFITVLLFLLALCPLAKAEIDSSTAEGFVKKITAQGIEQIINSDVSEAEKTDRFETLFNKYLDLDYIGRFVLGRYWKTATPQQQKEFLAVYKAFNIQTWSKRFDEFKGKKFVFNGTSPSNSEGQIFVNTTVPLKQGEPAKVVWRVKDTNGTYKIVDIIIENVSLAITARNEYTAYISKSAGGIDALISNLKSKIKE